MYRQTTQYREVPGSIPARVKKTFFRMLNECGKITSQAGKAYYYVRINAPMTYLSLIRLQKPNVEA